MRKYGFRISVGEGNRRVKKGKNVKLPVISIRGGPYELGFQHGSQSRAAVRANIDFYLNMWKYFGGAGRDQVLDEARKFIPYIEKLNPELLEELKGVAAGSETLFEEIVALNSRWELNYAYMPSIVRSSLEGCTAYALTPEATKNHHTFVGQHWDYKPHLGNSCIILRINREEKPNVIMHTEAGIIGHKGFNSAGIGVCLNFIRCEEDVFRPGFPVWLKIRRILDSESLPECIKTILTFEQPNSANLVIAHRDGEAIDAECTPKDVFFIHPEHGILTHTNHFQSFSFRSKDTGKGLLPDTVIRGHRAARLFQERRGDLEFDTIKDILTDHFGHPGSICRHRDERLHPYEQWETLTSMIIDLTEARMLYTAGPPCSYPYETVAMDENV